MKTLMGFVVIGILAACNTPSGEFKGIEPVTIQVEQSIFDVRISGSKAEAIRTNTEFSPNMSYVQDRAKTAIEQASGCSVIDGTMIGDPAMIRALLSCAP